MSNFLTKPTAASRSQSYTHTNPTHPDNPRLTYPLPSKPIFSESDARNTSLRSTALLSNNAGTSNYSMSSNRINKSPRATAHRRPLTRAELISRLKLIDSDPPLSLIPALPRSATTQRYQSAPPLDNRQSALAGKASTASIRPKPPTDMRRTQSSRPPVDPQRSFKHATQKGLPNDSIFRPHGLATSRS